MSKHTPGPWTVGPVERTKWSVFATTDGGDSVKVICCTAGNAREREDPQRAADAHLIAAAPDLLEALRDLYALYDRGVLKGPDALCAQVVHAAIVAIAKAEGR